MISYELGLGHIILIAWRAFVEWSWGGMLRQQNNENPPLTYSYTPTIFNSTNTQGNAIQGDYVNNSSFNQNFTPEPVTQSYTAQQPARQGNFESSPMSPQQSNERPSTYRYAPEISKSTNSQYNVIQGKSADHSHFDQNLQAERVTQLNAAQQLARPGNSVSSPMSPQRNNERPSSTHSYAPRISDSANTQGNAIQGNFVSNSSFIQNPTARLSTC